jgi:NAD(P)-dependent dehydrogenase (short-subunit alcohol dehydrogenase family)
MGRAIAEALAEFGADVAVHDVDAASCAGTVAAVRGFGRRSVAIGAPFGEPDAVARTVGAADAALGPIDILVSTVAVQTRTAYDRVTGEDFDRTVAINLAAFLDLVQRTAPGMVSRGWGRILAVGSVQQVRPHPEMIVYAATRSTSRVRRCCCAPMRGDTSPGRTFRSTVAWGCPRNLSGTRLTAGLGA